jgi:hypothetical protein
MYSHLILSPKTYMFYSFPLSIYSGRLYVELYEKSLVLPVRLPMYRPIRPLGLVVCLACSAATPLWVSCVEGK